MQVHNDFEQGSGEWLKIRHGKIGGTRAEMLYTDSDTLLLHLLSEITEPFDPDEEEYQSDAMLWGKQWEYEARQELSRYTGIKFNEVAWIQSDNPLVGVSPDGIDDTFTVGCEIKCPQRKKHIENCLDENIPKEYIRQCIHNFYVNDKLKTFYFASYRPTNLVKKISVRKITRESVVDVGLKKDGSVFEDRGLGLKSYKVKVPDIRTVQQWIDFCKERVAVIEVQIQEKLKILNF